MLYEIISMSDPYTIEAPTLQVAFVACLLLGEGQYAFYPCREGSTEIPILIFQDSGAAERWCQRNVGDSLENTLKRVTIDLAADLATCFDSCLIGTQQDRAIYLAALELIDDPVKRKTWRDQWHKKRLSSLNDIGGRAYEMAKRLRAGSKNPLVAAPAQVFTT